ncbi:FAD-binding oxidoreductase [Aquamicrobium sp. LC103]|uniref:NAD(P)/FAD-dependent oxidoreductase n=1 Tax=Aquamicrobium sp. LC103 TaxID=1120658 RepID=UPI00063E91BC|nr:FAD-binding oxidoreductase [Aquamicrobium sp. LC103]TKT74671.1 FAD-binding oxidoreductase [Aquamicrobium sp. LC103]
MAEHRTDIAIIGAGIVGLSTALELVERGRSVVVIDPDDALARASYGNAGVISRGSIFPVAGPGLLAKLPRYAMGRDIAVRIRLTSFPDFAAWLPRFLAAANEPAWRRAASALNPLVAESYSRHMALAERVGARHMIKRNGYLRLYRDQRGAAAAKLERSVLAEHGVRVEELDAGAIIDLEPHLRPRFTSGLFFADSGSVESPGTLVEAYADHLRARGTAFVKAAARSIEQGGDAVTVRAGDETIVAQKVVLSAGTRSAGLARALGCRIPLAAERGYHLHLRPAGNALLNRPVFDAAGGYVMSPMGELVRVLSGVELARPDDPRDERQIRAVVADAQRSLPLADTPGEKIWMGSRPSTPDGLPVIGHPRGNSRLFFAFGHGHIGFSNGPITGLVAAQMLSGETPAIPMAPFSPSRFGI